MTGRSAMTTKQRGFSTVELLVATAILIVLAAVGSVAYTGYMESVHKDLSKHQRDGLTGTIDIAVDLIQSGAKTNLVEPVSATRSRMSRPVRIFWKA